jgi:Cu-processing system permease protein
MLPSTMLLGAAFLSVGVWLSVVARRQSTAASLAVAVWFLLVFFYDLGLLAAMVASDGAIPEKAISWLVVLNPAGLYRSGMLAHLVGTVAVEDLGMTIVLPSLATRAGLWAAWILAPLAAASRALHGRGAVTS